MSGISPVSKESLRIFVSIREILVLALLRRHGGTPSGSGDDPFGILLIASMIPNASGWRSRSKLTMQSVHNYTALSSTRQSVHNAQSSTIYKKSVTVNFEQANTIKFSISTKCSSKQAVTEHTKEIVPKTVSTLK